MLVVTLSLCNTVSHFKNTLETFISGLSSRKNCASPKHIFLFVILFYFYLVDSIYCVTFHKRNFFPLCFSHQISKSKFEQLCGLYVTLIILYFNPNFPLSQFLFFIQNCQPHLLIDLFISYSSVLI